MPPIFAAPARSIPSRTAASDRRRRLWLTAFDGEPACEALPPNSLLAISPLMAWRESPAPKESQISPRGNPLHESVRGVFGITPDGEIRPTEFHRSVLHIGFP